MVALACVCGGPSRGLSLLVLVCAVALSLSTEPDVDVSAHRPADAQPQPPPAQPQQPEQLEQPEQQAPELGNEQPQQGAEAEADLLPTQQGSPNDDTVASPADPANPTLPSSSPHPNAAEVATEPPPSPPPPPPPKAEEPHAQRSLVQSLLAAISGETHNPAGAAEGPTDQVGVRIAALEDAVRRYHEQEASLEHVRQSLQQHELESEQREFALQQSLERTREEVSTLRQAAAAHVPQSTPEHVESTLQSTLARLDEIDKVVNATLQRFKAPAHAPAAPSDLRAMIREVLAEERPHREPSAPATTTDDQGQGGEEGEEGLEQRLDDAMTQIGELKHGLVTTKQQLDASLASAHASLVDFVKDHSKEINHTLMNRLESFGDLMVALDGSQVKLGHVLHQLWKTESAEMKAQVLQQAAVLLKRELEVAQSNLTQVSGLNDQLNYERRVAEQYMQASVNYETGAVHGKDGVLVEDGNVDTEFIRALRPEDPAMLHENLRIILDVAAMAMGAFVGGVVVMRFGVPVLIGYVVVGMLIGPSCLNLVAELTEVETFSQVGVILMLFVLGVEFRFEDLSRIGGVAIGGGTVLFALYVAVFGALCAAGGVVERKRDAVFIGACVALSSTAVVAKVLAEKKQAETEHGKVTLALLVSQDLGIGLVLSLMPAFSDPPPTPDGNGGLGDEEDDTPMDAPKNHFLDSEYLFILLFTLTQLMALSIAATVWTTWVMPRLFKLLNSLRDELYLLGILSHCFGVGFVTHWMDLGLELGAFVAGLMIVSHEDVERTLRHISALSNLFGAMFFVSIGLIMSPGFVVRNLVAIAVLTVVVMALKTLLCAVLVRAFNYNWRTSFVVGAGIGQVGEYAYLVASKGQGMGFITRRHYLHLISSTTLSLFVTPFCMAVMDRFCNDGKGYHRIVPAEEGDSQSEGEGPEKFL